MLVVLHGRGDSPAGFTWLQGQLNIDGLNVLLLQAPDDYYGGYSWYGMPPDQLPGIQRSRVLLDQVFQQITKSGFPADRCLLFGFSQGCLMTLEFGSRFFLPLAGYIGISGYAYDPDLILKEASKAVMLAPWLITHGTQDEVISVETTRAQMKTLIAGGFKIEYREYEKTHTIDDQKELPYLEAWIRERMGSSSPSSPGQ